MVQNAKKFRLEPFDARDWRLGIVCAKFNSHITNQMQKSVLARAKKYSLSADSITVAEVVGVIEIPLALQKMAASGKYQALVAIGCVIKGETAHFEYVSKYVTEGILRVQLDYKMPIAFSVLTCDNEEQALARTMLSGEHLDAVLHQARLLREI